jgi:hypothetical protein
MPSTFPTVTAPTPAQAGSLLVNRGAAAGASMPSGGLSMTDYLAWMVAELLTNGPAGTAASVTNGITAFATGGQASATALTTPINRVTTCATIGDSVKLPTSTAGALVVVTNSGATGLDIFPATGDVINTLAANTAIRIATGTTVVFTCPVAGTWFASPTPLPYAKFTTINVTVGTLAVGDITGAAFVNLTSTNATPGTQTTRTATQMFADTPNARVGDVYMLRITNTGAGVFTLGAGTGVTLTGTMTIAQNVFSEFTVTFTSATAVVIQKVGQGTFS